jgi:hypothetical protein
MSNPEKEIAAENNGTQWSSDMKTPNFDPDG